MMIISLFRSLSLAVFKVLYFQLDWLAGGPGSLAELNRISIQNGTDAFWGVLVTAIMITIVAFIDYAAIHGLVIACHKAIVWYKEKNIAWKAHLERKQVQEQLIKMRFKDLQ